MRGRPKGSKNKQKCSEVNNVHVPCTKPFSETVESRLLKDPEFKRLLELEHLVGKLVTYYSEGYRAGYLDSVSKDGKTAKIQPIPAYRAGTPHKISVDASTVSLA